MRVVRDVATSAPAPRFFARERASHLSFSKGRRTAGIIGKLRDHLLRRIRQMAESSAARRVADGPQVGTERSVDLAELVVSNHAAVYRYACRLCGCPTEAED